MPETPGLPPSAAATLTGEPAPQDLRQRLQAWAPFAQMAPAQVDAFIADAQPLRFARDQVLLSPQQGPAPALLLILQGSVSGRRDDDDGAGAVEYLAGELFPSGSVLNRRAVTATYTANEPGLCLSLPAERARQLVALSPAFADHLQHRAQQFLALWRRATQAAWSARALAELSLEARLGSLPAKPPLACGADTALAEALGRMQQQGVGSVVVVDAEQAPLGILTRHDILGRITLPQRPLSAAIGSVMSSPVHTLSVDDTLQDAMLLMARKGLRHVPVTDGGRLVGIVSERDLFARQRLSLKQVGSQIQAAGDVPALQATAGRIQQLAGHLLGQGVHARQITRLISDLNDLLTARLVGLTTARHGLALQRCCWLAFGSEGRSEQTVVTDQDNGLVFVAADAELERPRWLAMAMDVNLGLEACGFPLCKGQVMASNPQLCLTVDEWLQRFEHGIAHGAPQDLLAASIFFDLRALAGDAGLASPLIALIQRQAARTPRFIKQLADNALQHRPPLNWRGGIAATEVDGRQMIDLKLQGTALFVDAARLLALAQGLGELGTRSRLEAAAPGLGVSAAESGAWVAAFEFLQALRLQRQLAQPGKVDDQGNQLDLASLNDIELRMLKASMRTARQLQQRIALDYQR